MKKLVNFAKEVYYAIRRRCRPNRHPSLADLRAAARTVHASEELEPDDEFDHNFGPSDDNSVDTQEKIGW